MGPPPTTCRVAPEVVDTAETVFDVVALPALTVGIVAGIVRLRRDGAGVDALMAVTLGAWAIYAAYLLLHYEAGWRGRRAAYLALAGFALVIVARLGLQLTHFS